MLVYQSQKCIYYNQLPLYFVFWKKTFVEIKLTSVRNAWSAEAIYLFDT